MTDKLVTHMTGLIAAGLDCFKQYEEAYQYALHLAKALRENYPPNPDFRFLGDLVGLLTQIDNMVAGLSLTTDRDAAYARGYSDAETEISKSALEQSNAFLHSQYANAKLRIEALTVDRAEARAGWHKCEAAWMTAEGKLADAEALIEAQAKDHASNNIRFAEAEHRAKTAEAERDRLREERDAILLDGTVHSDQREKYERLCARIAAGKASQQDAVDAIRQLCRDNERLALRRSDARAEAAEAERDSYRKALEDIIKDYEPGYPLSHDTIKYAARAALKGATP